MTFALTILGVNGATPANGRFPTCQYLQIQNDHFLIDCGEGAQMRMNDFSVPRQKINHIFISHLHGDHIFGLPGLLFSYSLNGRKKPLHLYSPPGLEKMIRTLLHPEGNHTFPLHFHTYDAFLSKRIFENECLSVRTVPLRHRIPTCGFIFEEKPFKLNIRPEKIKEFELTIPQIRAVKNGEDIVIPNGKKIANETLTFPEWQPRSFAFVSDSIFDETIVPFIEKVDLLYHETTFCDDFEDNAARTMHSTARQAATIANTAQVGKLVTGHYSSRYTELGSFLTESKAVFPNTELGLEGNVYEVERKRKSPA